MVTIFGESDHEEEGARSYEQNQRRVEDKLRRLNLKYHWHRYHPISLESRQLPASARKETVDEEKCSPPPLAWVKAHVTSVTDRSSRRKRQYRRDDGVDAAPLAGLSVNLESRSDHLRGGDGIAGDEQNGAAADASPRDTPLAMLEQDRGSADCSALPPARRLFVQLDGDSGPHSHLRQQQLPAGNGSTHVIAGGDAVRDRSSHSNRLAGDRSKDNTDVTSSIHRSSPLPQQVCTSAIRKSTSTGPGGVDCGDRLMSSNMVGSPNLDGDTANCGEISANDDERSPAAAAAASHGSIYGQEDIEDSTSKDGNGELFYFQDCREDDEQSSYHDIDNDVCCLPGSMEPTTTRTMDVPMVGCEQEGGEREYVEKNENGSMSIYSSKPRGLRRKAMVVEDFEDEHDGNLFDTPIHEEMSPCSEDPTVGTASSYVSEREARSPTAATKTMIVSAGSKVKPLFRMKRVLLESNDDDDSTRNDGEELTLADNTTGRGSRCSREVMIRRGPKSSTVFCVSPENQEDVVGADNGCPRPEGASNRKLDRNGTLDEERSSSIDQVSSPLHSEQQPHATTDERVAEERALRISRAREFPRWQMALCRADFHSSAGEEEADGSGSGSSNTDDDIGIRKRAVGDLDVESPSLVKVKGPSVTRVGCGDRGDNKSGGDSRATVMMTLTAAASLKDGQASGEEVLRSCSGGSADAVEQEVGAELIDARDESTLCNGYIGGFIGDGDDSQDESFAPEGQQAGTDSPLAMAMASEDAGGGKYSAEDAGLDGEDYDCGDGDIVRQSLVKAEKPLRSPRHQREDVEGVWGQLCSESENDHGAIQGEVVKSLVRPADSTLSAAGSGGRDPNGVGGKKDGKTPPRQRRKKARRRLLSDSEDECTSNDATKHKPSVSAALLGDGPYPLHKKATSTVGGVPAEDQEQRIDRAREILRRQMSLCRRSDYFSADEERDGEYSSSSEPVFSRGSGNQQQQVALTQDKNKHQKEQHSGNAGTDDFSPGVGEASSTRSALFSEDEETDNGGVMKAPAEPKFDISSPRILSRPTNGVSPPDVSPAVEDDGAPLPHEQVTRDVERVAAELQEERINRAREMLTLQMSLSQRSDSFSADKERDDEDNRNSEPSFSHGSGGQQVAAQSRYANENQEEENSGNATADDFSTKVDEAASTQRAPSPEQQQRWPSPTPGSCCGSPDSGGSRDCEQSIGGGSVGLVVDSTPHNYRDSVTDRDSIIFAVESETLTRMTADAPDGTRTIESATKSGATTTAEAEARREGPEQPRQRMVMDFGSDGEDDSDGSNASLPVGSPEGRPLNHAAGKTQRWGAEPAGRNDNGKGGDVDDDQVLLPMFGRETAACNQDEASVHRDSESVNDGPSNEAAAATTVGTDDGFGDDLVDTDDSDHLVRRKIKKGRVGRRLVLGSATRAARRVLDSSSEDDGEVDYSDDDGGGDADGSDDHDSRGSRRPTKYVDRIVDDDEGSSNFGGSSSSSNNNSNNSSSESMEDDKIAITDGAASSEEGDSDGKWSTDIVKKSQPSSRAGRHRGTSQRIAEDDEAGSSGNDRGTAKPAAFKSPPPPRARRHGCTGGGVGSDNTNSSSSSNAGDRHRWGGGGGKAFRDAETPTAGNTATTPPVKRRPTTGKPRQVAKDGGGAGGSSSVRKSTVSNPDGLCGPAFFKARDSLTVKYFTEFNKGAFGGSLSHVRVTWSKRLLRTAGVTKSRREYGGGGRAGVGGPRYTSEVELSAKVVDTEAKLKETLLHELCHAAAWVIDHKSNPPHGKHFWSWANRAKQAHPGVPVTTCHSYDINYKYRYVCVGQSGGVDGVGCGAEIGRHSKSIDVVKQVCGRCRGKLMLFGTHGKDGKLKTPRKASAFSLFVKEWYADVKRGMPPGTSNQQVMKAISELWAARNKPDAGLSSTNNDDNNNNNIINNGDIDAHDDRVEDDGMIEAWTAAPRRGTVHGGHHADSSGGDRNSGGNNRGGAGVVTIGGRNKENVEIVDLC